MCERLLAGRSLTGSPVDSPRCTARRPRRANRAPDSETGATLHRTNGPVPPRSDCKRSRRHGGVVMSDRTVRHVGNVKLPRTRRRPCRGLVEKLPSREVISASLNVVPNGRANSEEGSCGGGTLPQPPATLQLSNPATHYSSIPAIVAVKKFANVPASIARIPRRARSPRLVGASDPMPPIWMAIEEKLAKPQSA